jgi:hypothetical protein
MLRFHDVQELGNAGKDAVMVARGPFDAAEERIIELCVWVFQRGENDAAATEMTTGHAHDDHVTFDKDDRGRDRWNMPLRQVGDFPLTGGEAFGVAIAMLEMKKEDDAQRVIWWGHPLKLNDPSGADEEAEDLEKRAY